MRTREALSRCSKVFEETGKISSILSNICDSWLRRSRAAFRDFSLRFSEFLKNETNLLEAVIKGDIIDANYKSDIVDRNGQIDQRTGRKWRAFERYRDTSPKTAIGSASAALSTIDGTVIAIDPNQHCITVHQSRDR